MDNLISETVSQQRRRRAVIFESYGWSDAADIAQRIKASLEEHDFEVWLDSDHISPDETDFWSPLQIALERCDLVIALLSPHSVRLENDAVTARNMSICHNELILAVRLKKAVVSVAVIDCEPPLAINHYEPIDLTNWSTSSSAYDDGVCQVVHWIREGLAGRHRYRIYVDNLSQDRMSFPEEQTAALGFVGRNWLMDRIMTWLEDRNSCFVIEAEPGAGKTALVAELLRRNPDDRILAYHFCNAQREDTLDPRCFIRSLAAMLCGTVAPYRGRLRASEDIVRALKSDGQPVSMLWQGILEPLNRISFDRPRYIVVDALDEAVDAGGDWAASIPRLLASSVDKFPPWLKLMVTTRPHDRVLPLFQGASQCVLGEAIAEQRDDLRHFIEHRLGPSTLNATDLAEAARRAPIIDTLAERSGGNFQYAETVIEELSAGTLGAADIDSLPRSLAGLYHNRADARFPDGEGYGDARIMLGVLQTAREPLSRSQLAAITGLARDDVLTPLLRKLSCFVLWDPDIGEEGIYRIAHKSIGDWLLASTRGFDRFRIDVSEARERLISYCRNWPDNREAYALRNLIAHLLEGGLKNEALELIRTGFFEKRRQYMRDGSDFGDARDLTLALIGDGDTTAIVELARTRNIGQRDGVAAALLTAPPEADALVDGIVAALLKTG